MKKPANKPQNHQQPAGKPRDFAGLPGFDHAMRKIADVSKAELERREQAERDAKESSR